MFKEGRRDVRGTNNFGGALSAKTLQKFRKNFAIEGSVACAERKKSAAPLSVPRRVKSIC